MIHLFHDVSIMKLLILVGLFSFGYCNKYGITEINDGQKSYIRRQKNRPDNNDALEDSKVHGPTSYLEYENKKGYGKKSETLRRDMQKYNDESGPFYDAYVKNNNEYKNNEFIENYGINSRGLKDGRYYDEETQKRLDRIFGYTGPTANDEAENLMRPCSLDDWQCIRNFFAANGKCTPAFGPIPDPLEIDLNSVFFPVVNLTVVLTEFELRGLSRARVNDFYLNKRTGNLVFAVDIQNLNQSTPRAYFRYKRTARESIILSDSATVNFRSITFTAVIPKVPDLRLDFADVHADAQDGTPVFAFGPGAFNSTDPDVISALALFQVNLPIGVRESFIFQAPLFMAIYIQKNICDFGLKLISN